MILFVYGTRPEALKIRPVVAEATRRGLPVHVHCTMQSPDLLSRDILPWHTLDGEWPPVDRDEISLVVVQGDTRTAFRAALHAYELGIPVFHVEAGLRTHDTSSPWPEEGYRQMIARIARYHACTSTLGLMHLIEEKVGTSRNLPTATIRVTGSPVVESARERLMGLIGRPSHPASGSQILVTLHRRENRPHFADILAGVEDARLPTERVCWPAHPNAWAVEANPTALVPTTPLDPWDFIDVLASCRLVVTDSGGVQEEAHALGVPCVVTRTVTDRPETIGAGGGVLAGVTREGVAQAIRVARALDTTQITRTAYGTGHASRQIVDWLQEIVR